MGALGYIKQTGVTIKGNTGSGRSGSSGGDHYIAGQNITAFICNVSSGHGASRDTAGSISYQFGNLHILVIGFQLESGYLVSLGSSQNVLSVVHGQIQGSAFV